MASSRYPTDNKATYDSASEPAIEVVPRDESNPHSTPFAGFDNDNIVNAGEIRDDPYLKRSDTTTTRGIPESEEDQQHVTDIRTPLVRVVEHKKGWKKGWSRINDMGITTLLSFGTYLYLPDRV